MYRAVVVLERCDAKDMLRGQGLGIFLLFDFRLRASKPYNIF